MISNDSIHIKSWKSTNKYFPNFCQIRCRLHCHWLIFTLRVTLLSVREHIHILTFRIKKKFIPCAGMTCTCKVFLYRLPSEWSHGFRDICFQKRIEGI